MASTSSITTFSDLHPVIIQTQILPRLDGQSLSSVATTSSYLRTITADDILWSDICKSTWLSITHPRINHVISTFSAGHRSFFQDSFQPPTTDVKHLTCRRSWSNTQPSCSLTHHPWPSELILAVDIRFHNNIVYSRVEITDTTTNFLTSELRIVLNDDPARNQSGFELGSIDLKVDKLLHADDETISHLKESVTLNWILIDPTRKRAVNLSSIKPVLAWVDNHVHLRYVIVLPGCDSSERVECRIEVTLVVDKGGVALHVREVILHVKDASCNCLKGKDFLVITSRVFLERYNMGRVMEGVEGEVGSIQKETVWSWVDYNYIKTILSFLLWVCFLYISTLINNTLINKNDFATYPSLI